MQRAHENYGFQAACVGIRITCSVGENLPFTQSQEDSSFFVTSQKVRGSMELDKAYALRFL